MRKYYQLLLLIVSIISVGLLLIYRHEYNRLRYVLEVFDFFGKPSDCTFPDLLNTSTTTIQHDWGPVPVWTRIINEENAVIYSAFLKNENDIEALIVHDEDKIIIKSCYLWLEDNTKLVIGKINYSKIQTISDNNLIKLAFYKYYCHADSVSEIPYAVSFTNKNKRIKNLKKIPLNPLFKKKYYFTTICVVPSEFYSKQQIVEFISFHKILGVDSFIIYNNNIPHKFIRLLQKMSMKLGLEIVNYPWNYPYESSSSIRSIIEEDCLLRTREKSRNIMILNWSEFIVPRHHHAINSLLDNYDKSNRTNRFVLKTLTFCLDDNDKKEPAILHSLQYDETKNEEKIYIHRSNNYENNAVVNTQEISTTVAAVHKYLPCVSRPIHHKMDSVLLKFSSDMRKSTLFKLFKYDRL